MPPPSPRGSALPTAWYASTSCVRCFTAANSSILNAMTDHGAPLPTEIDRDPAHLAAADWLFRLQSTEVSIEDTLAWQAWLNADPTHAQAFARMEEISQVLRSVPAPSAASPRQVARDRYDASVPIKDWNRRHAPGRRAAIALAASIAALALTAAFWKTLPASNSFATAIGETRNVTLSDGSTIALGGDTQ